MSSRKVGKRPDGHLAALPYFSTNSGGNADGCGPQGIETKEKKYKVTDRDGMYVLVMPTGAITFRYDYRLNGRRETVIIGRYGRSGISLARAREMLMDARRMVAEGRSPAHEKTRQKRRLKEEISISGGDPKCSGSSQ